MNTEDDKVIPLHPPVTTSITINRADLDLFTVHDVVDAIKALGVKLTPEQEFRVTALVKRHDHYSKAGVYSKILMWLGWCGERESLSVIKWALKYIELKIETHNEMKHLPDEKIVTWSVGSHVFKQ